MFVYRLIVFCVNSKNYFNAKIKKWHLHLLNIGNVCKM